MSNLIGLVGAAGAGKDTVADFLVKNHGYKRYAFADAVRDMALAINPLVNVTADGSARYTYYVRLYDLIEAYGWDYAKREVPEVRRILQKVGTEAVRDIAGHNTWVNIVHAKWRKDNFPNAVITDVRFGNELEYVDGNEGHIVKIERPDNPDAIEANHASEKLVVPDAWVYRSLVNDGTLEELEDAVADLVGALGPGLV